MQLNGSAKCSSSQPQGIPFGSSPRAPLNNYGQPEHKELLAKFPLQSFDLPALLFVVEV